VEAYKPEVERHGSTFPQEDGAAKPSHRVLIVDDDAALAAQVVDYLKGARFAAHVVTSVHDMCRALEAETPDAIILGLTLPDDSGWNALRWLRARSDLPVIMVAARGDVVDRIVSLELGADDCVVKPFELRELVARLKCVLRRVDQRAAQSDAVLPRKVDFGEWTLDFASQQLKDDRDERMHLTPAEYSFLSLLVRHPHHVITRDQLASCLGARDWDPLNRSVDIHIGKLRSKIDRDPRQPSFIRTVRGAGYMFVPERG